MTNYRDSTDGEGCAVADIDGDFDLDYIWSNNSRYYIFLNQNFTYRLITTESIGCINNNVTEVT